MFYKLYNMVKFYKIRKLTSKNKTGDIFGVSIPNKIIEQFGECDVSIQTSGTCLMLTSGANLQHKRFL